MPTRRQPRAHDEATRIAAEREDNRRRRLL
jgi:hypothetical protein